MTKGEKGDWRRPPWRAFYEVSQWSQGTLVDLSLAHSHPWDVTPAEAIRIQRELARHVIRRSGFAPGSVRTVAGVDSHFRGGSVFAAAVVLSYPGLELLEAAVAEDKAAFPYVPGLLTFREGPVILKALSRLRRVADVIVFDGQGIAHPRRFGIASHIGVLLDRPTVGCAKTRLCGRHEEPEKAQGSYALLKDRGRVIGAAVRTRSCVNPVYVSCGHRTNLRHGIRIVLGCCSGFRLPETTRYADRLARTAGSPSG